jgi:hypothetical protein
VFGVAKLWSEWLQQMARAFLVRRAHYLANHNASEDIFTGKENASLLFDIFVW